MMKEIKCPHCKQVFSVDESAFESIALQVRDSLFEEELERREAQLRKSMQAEFKAQQAEDDKKASAKLSKKDADLNAKDSEIALLKEQLRNIGASKDSEMKTKQLEMEQERDKLVAQKDSEIERLKGELSQQDSKIQMALLKEQKKATELLQKKETKIIELTGELKTQKANSETELAHLKEQHKIEIEKKDEEIQFHKDYKLRLSTKMLGETLEQHCYNAFRQAQAMGMFPRAYFDKDNDAASGTKGDFIFRDFDEDGNEYISIMFEMKNEADATASKHRNDDFLDKLHKDRTEKHCEYAVLVSMLERDNELYNAGIVNKSYVHDKMFVIRPQMFMIIISLLAQAARKNQQLISSLRHDLAIAQAQSVDITNFEQRRDKFAETFSKLVQGHTKKQEDAIEGIDKVITTLEKQAESLRKVKSLFDESRKKLEKANSAIESDFTIKKLTRGNKTMQVLFREAAEQAALQPPADSDTPALPDPDSQE
ncbi:MAG: DUF2130 domain-containing protein [Sodaliphilus sp.]